MKNTIIFWHENSENNHAKKTDTNHLPKEKYSVAEIIDIRNELLQFHEADGQICEIRFLRHEHISSSIWWYQRAYANPCGQRIFLRFLMLMKSQFRSCTYYPFSVSFSDFLLQLHWKGRFRNCTGLGWHRFPVSETRAFLSENREDRWHVSDSGRKFQYPWYARCQVQINFVLTKMIQILLFLHGWQPRLMKAEWTVLVFFKML